MASLAMLSLTHTLIALPVCNYMFLTMRGSCVPWLRCLRDCGGIFRRSPTNPFDASVRRMIIEIRARRVTNMVAIAEPMMVVGACWSFCWYMSLPLDTRDGTAYHTELALQGRLAVGLWLFRLVSVFPNSNLDRVALSMSWGIFALQVTLGSTSTSFLLLNRPIIVLARCVNGLFFNSVYQTAIQNITICAVFCRSYFLVVELDTCQPMSSDMFVQQECVIATIVIALSWISQRSLDMEARAILHQKEASDARTTVQSLLSVVCDAVLHIRADMIISEPAPKLAAMLLNAAFKLEGRSFLDLMIPGDTTRFQELCHMAQQQKHAVTLNAGLTRATAFTVLNVKLFIACSWDLDDQPGYIIGVAEQDEQLQRAPARLASIEDDDCQPERLPRCLPWASESLSEVIDDAPSCASGPSFSRLVTGSTVGDQCVPEVAFNAESELFTICSSCSAVI
jgi:hypothetical protein